MDEQFVARAIAELIEATGQAIAIATTALASQGDPEVVRTALAKGMKAAQAAPDTSPIALNMLRKTVALLDLQARPKH